MLQTLRWWNKCVIALAPCFNRISWSDVCEARNPLVAACRFNFHSPICFHLLNDKGLEPGIVNWGCIFVFLVSLLSVLCFLFMFLSLFPPLGMFVCRLNNWAGSSITNSLPAHIWRLCRLIQIKYSICLVFKMKTSTSPDLCLCFIRMIWKSLQNVGSSVNTHTHRDTHKSSPLCIWRGPGIDWGQAYEHNKADKCPWAEQKPH